LNILTFLSSFSLSFLLFFYFIIFLCCHYSCKYHSLYFFLFTLFLYLLHYNLSLLQLFSIYTKINSKWIKVLSVQSESLKWIEKNKKWCMGTGNYFLNRTLRART
jgi:hypothetical protein